MDPAILVDQFGPTGAVVALGIYGLKALMPLVAAAVGHLKDISNAMQKIVLHVTVIEQKLDRVQEAQSDLAIAVGDVSQDLAGLYGSIGKPRPSRSGTGALRGATGD